MLRKFQRDDEEYFEKREAFAAKYDDANFWFIADNWPLFSGTVNIARFLAIYELVKKVLHLPGHFCELGCWNGTNLVFLAKLLNILKPRTAAEVIGFDSFKGLQEFDNQNDLSGENTRGKYQGNMQLLESVLRLYNLQNAVEIIKGNIEDTVPNFLEGRKDMRFAFIYLDADLYPPTKVALECLYPRLLKGGIVALDEYNLAGWPGETRAVHDVLGENVIIESFPFTRQPTAYIIK